MKTDERVWKIMQKRLGYTEEEIQAFRENPRNADMLAKSAKLANKAIILEVVASHGCNSGYKVGDKFYFDGAGNPYGTVPQKSMRLFVKLGAHDGVCGK